MTSDRSEISSITEKRSSSTSSSSGSNKLQRKDSKPETKDSEVELLIHLIGPTMGKSNKGQKSYVSIDRNIFPSTESFWLHTNKKKKKNHSVIL